MNNNLEKRTAAFIVHGFRSDSSSSGYMARVLVTQYRVFTIDLDLTFQTLDSCVEELRQKVKTILRKHDINAIHFVCHSTGGPAVRKLLHTSQSIAIKTVTCILVAVPNKGSILADIHQLLPLPIRNIHKPLASLTREFANSTYTNCPEHVSFGGIAGLRNLPATRNFFKSSNDGAVAASSAYLNGMLDFVLLPCTHLTIMCDFSAVLSVLHFMRFLEFPKVIYRMNKTDMQEKMSFIFSHNAIDEFCKECGANWELETMGGSIWWNTVAEADEWRLQENKLTSHVRLLNPSGLRKAWGSKHAMNEAMDLIMSRIRSQEYIKSQVPPVDESPVEARLKKLKNLREKDLISEKDYTDRKSEILKNI